MTLKEQIMKLQTYKMYEGEDTVYVERDDVLKALEREPCSDTISRKEVLEALEQEEPLVWCDGADEIAAHNQWESDVDTIKNMPTVQPKPIECEDAISREDAMSMILCYGNEIKAEVMDDIKASMIKLPPVQPKIKTGHWIHRSTDEYGGITTWYECSECGRSVEDIYHVYGEYPYCHCGAKMIESQESEGKE